jgi:hypothetical protein
VVANLSHLPALSIRFPRWPVVSLHTFWALSHRSRASFRRPNASLCAFRLLHADDSISLNRGVRAARSLLPKIIRVTENFRSSMNHFDCAGAPPFHRVIGQVLTMLTVIMGIFIVLGIGILVAHALEVFRSD